MGFTTSYWQKERWSRRAADTLTSYGRCWNPSLGNRGVNWRVGALSEEQTPQVIVFSGRVSEEEEQKDRLLCAQAPWARSIALPRNVPQARLGVRSLQLQTSRDFPAPLVGKEHQYNFEFFIVVYDRGAPCA